MYEIVVFDLDGTLLDTLEDLHRSVNFALSAHALATRSREEVRSFVGDGIQKLIQRAAGDISPTLLEKVLATFKAHYAAHCQDATKPYEGVTELLSSLKARGVKTAVVSNKADFATKKLAKFYFDGLLGLAVGENEAQGVRKKPAPDALLSVIAALGGERDKTAYVGDSEVDIQTAKNAGVRCISVTWGFKEREFLLKNGAEILVDAPKEILKEV